VILGQDQPRSDAQEEQVIIGFDRSSESTPKTGKKKQIYSPAFGFSMTPKKVDPSIPSYPYFGYLFFNSLGAAGQAASLVLIWQLYAQSNITTFEIVYVQCAVEAIVLFAALLVKRIYVLGIPVSQRSVIVTKGIMHFAAVSLQYLAVKRLTDPMVNLIIAFSTTCVT